MLSDGTRGSSEGARSAICGESVGICDSLLFTVRFEGIDSRENNSAHLVASMLNRIMMHIDLCDKRSIN